MLMFKNLIGNRFVLITYSLYFLYQNHFLMAALYKYQQVDLENLIIIRYIKRFRGGFQYGHPKGFIYNG